MASLTVIPVFPEQQEDPVLTETASNIFIHSSPVNASIIIDGSPVLQKTPALLRNITPGRHRIGLRKEGFSAADFTVEIRENTTVVTETELLRGRIVITFPEAQQVHALSGGELQNLSSSMIIPGGEYSFRIDNGNIDINPVYPKNIFFGVTTGLFFVSCTATAIAAISELSDTGELYYPHSTGLAVIESVTAVTGLTELALILDRKNYLDGFAAEGIDPDINDREAVKLMEEGHRMLVEGSFENALTEYSRIISRYPDFKDIPEAVYLAAKIHLFSGNSNLAAAELRILKDRYQDAGIYDKACQTLAVLYYNNGELQKSRETVSEMVFYDPIFTETPAKIKENGIDAVLQEWAGTVQAGEQE